jgi:hypothetical protein
MHLSCFTYQSFFNPINSIPLYYTQSHSLNPPLLNPIHSIPGQGPSGVLLSPPGPGSQRRHGLDRRYRGRGWENDCRLQEPHEVSGGEVPDTRAVHRGRGELEWWLLLFSAGINYVYSEIINKLWLFVTSSHLCWTTKDDNYRGGAHLHQSFQHLSSS